MNHARTINTALAGLCAYFSFCGEVVAQDPAPVEPGLPEAAPQTVPEIAPEPEPPIAVVPPPQPVPPAPAVATTAPAPDADGNDDAKDAAKKKKKLEIGGRLHAGYSLTREAASPTDSGRTTENAFDVRRANVQFTWRPDDWLKAVVQIDVAEAFELGTSLLTDAYVHVAPIPQLQLRVGQFKKPFSALVLQSPSKLRIIERGPGVAYIAEELRYGDRDLGLQLSGVIVEAAKLEYSVGVFNGNGPNIAERGNSKDVAARLQVRPIKEIEIGANMSAKFITDPQERQPGHALAGGGDLRVGIEGFRFYTEGLVAQDHAAYAINADATAKDAPVSFVVLAIASYRHKFRAGRLRMAVEPAFKAELFDPDADVADDHLWVLTPGINGYFGDYFKLMVDGEFTRSGRNARDDTPDAEAIEVLACFDI
jgi:hypothetical protein